MGNETEDPKKGWEAAGLFFPGFLLLGLGIGWAMGYMIPGLFIGLGAGFIVMALVRLIVTRK